VTTPHEQEREARERVDREAQYLGIEFISRAEEDDQRERYDNAMADYRKAIIEAEWADSTRAISLLVEWMLMDGGHEVEVTRIGKYFTARLTAHDGAVTKFLGHGESLIGAIFDCHERSKQ
jgi:hypothetical protein